VTIDRVEAIFGEHKKTRRVAGFSFDDVACGDQAVA
jgi:hypothetical protein